MGRSDLVEPAPTRSDPQCCPIVAGRECTIEICKGNLGLGLSIVGGCDTLLVRAANFMFADLTFFLNWPCCHEASASDSNWKEIHVVVGKKYLLKT